MKFKPSLLSNFLTLHSWIIAAWTGRECQIVSSGKLQKCWDTAPPNDIWKMFGGRGFQSYLTIQQALLKMRTGSLVCSPEGEVIITPLPAFLSSALSSEVYEEILTNYISRSGLGSKCLLVTNSLIGLVKWGLNIVFINLCHTQLVSKSVTCLCWL